MKTEFKTIHCPDFGDVLVNADLIGSQVFQYEELSKSKRQEAADGLLLSTIDPTISLEELSENDRVAILKVIIAEFDTLNVYEDAIASQSSYFDAFRIAYVKSRFYEGSKSSLSSSYFGISNPFGANILGPSFNSKAISDAIRAVAFTPPVPDFSKIVQASSQFTVESNRLAKMVESIAIPDFANAVGLRPVGDIQSVIGKQNNDLSTFRALEGISDFAKSLSTQMKSLDPRSAFWDRGVAAQLSSIKDPIGNGVLSSLISSIADIEKMNQALAGQLSDLAISQMLVANNFSTIAKSLSDSHLNQFNVFNNALHGISKTFLSGIAVSLDWEAITIFKEVNETVLELTNEVGNDSGQITKQDLEELRESIVRRLSVLLQKSKGQKAMDYILAIITVISFVLTLYSFRVATTDKSNSEVISQLGKEIKELTKDISEGMEFDSRVELEMLVAKRDAILRFSEQKYAKKIGLVKRGQEVTVIERRTDFLLVSYIDSETGAPMSGFVNERNFVIRESLKQ